MLRPFCFHGAADTGVSRPSSPMASRSENTVLCFQGCSRETRDSA